MMHKKLISLATAAMMMTVSFAGAVSLPENTPFKDLENVEFYFSSGVGGWYTRMVIAPDRTFTGDFHDSEMGDSAESYPNGTVYGCLFHGTLSAASQMDDYTWLLNMDELLLDEGQLPEFIEDGIRYITTDSVYGLENTTELLLYLPGHDLSTLPEGYMMWSHLNLWETMPETLPFYGLYNMVEECGFVGETILSAE